VPQIRTIFLNAGRGLGKRELCGWKKIESMERKRLCQFAISSGTAELCARLQSPEMALSGQ
jgi:hypothetical protein